MSIRETIVEVKALLDEGLENGEIKPGLHQRAQQRLDQISGSVKEKYPYRYTLFIDAGHGGINPDTKQYVTPTKRYSHLMGQFHNGTSFYEGVFNRQVAEKLQRKMQVEGAPYRVLYDDWMDIKLSTRTKIVNKSLEAGIKGFVLSIHANASPKHNASGFEIWTERKEKTTIGRKKAVSDMIASRLWNRVREEAPRFNMRMRADRSDNDPDYEAAFWMLRQPECPAILVECGFFDNYKDALTLMNEDYQDMLVEAFWNTYVDVNETIAL